MLGPWREKMKARINGRSQTKDTPPPQRRQCGDFFFFLIQTHRENATMLTMGWAWEQLDMKGGEGKLCKWELGEKVEKRNKTHGTTFLRPGSSALSGDLCRGPWVHPPTSSPTHKPVISPSLEILLWIHWPPQLPFHWEAQLEQRFLRLDLKEWGMRGSTNWKSSGGVTDGRSLGVGVEGEYQSTLYAGNSQKLIKHILEVWDFHWKVQLGVL